MVEFAFVPERIAAEEDRAHGLLAVGRIYQPNDTELRRKRNGELRLVEQWGGSCNIAVTGDISKLEVGVPVTFTKIGKA